MNQLNRKRAEIKLKFPHTTSFAHTNNKWQSLTKPRHSTLYSLRRWMFTNKMIRMHDCVTWNAFSNLWNCINSLDFCHQYSGSNVPCSIFFFTIAYQSTKTGAEFWTIFSHWNEKGKQGKRSKNGNKQQKKCFDEFGARAFWYWSFREWKTFYSWDKNKIICEESMKYTDKKYALWLCLHK